MSFILIWTFQKGNKKKNTETIFFKAQDGVILNGIMI